MNASAPFLSLLVLRVRFFACAAVLCLPCTAAFGQAPPAAGDYTTALPSVERVETAIQGTDPTDTVARQVAVFEYLQVYIQRIKEARDYRGSYTPGELKLRTDYSKAQYDLTQSFTKSHSQQEVGKFSQLEGNYSINNALDWIKQLEGQQAADTYKGAENSLSQSYQRNQDRIQQGLQQTNGQSGGGLLDGLTGGGAGSGDLKPEQKRCLELGGTLKQCANAMMGLVNLIGNIVAMGAEDNSPQQPPLSGVILVGSYHSRTDLPEVALGWNGAAVLSKCGTLVEGTRTYTLRKSGAATQIAVDNEPDPIVLTLRSDGSLSGPGNIQVKGSIISGYHNVTTCTREGTPYASCGTTSTPIYAASMQRCTVSQLAPQPAPPPPPKPTGLVGQVGDLFGTGDPVATIYGFRMIGPYASSNGMQLAFDNGYVTLDCGQAHVNAPYTVDNTASGFVIHVQNGGGAFLLGVAPDTTLRGSGSTTVNGRLVSAVNGDNVNFTPHSESCSVGTFAPKGKQNTMLASNGPTPVVPASYAAGSPVSDANAPAAAEGGSAPIATTLASAGISSSPSGTRAQFRVLLSSSFGGANPLVGQAVFVSRKPMDQILRELGVAVPANATPGQAMKALQMQCHSAQGCSAVIQGMPKYYVTTTKLDTSGKATLSATATTGQYYFFAIVPNAGGSLVWDLPANLAAGDNEVAFNQANAERVE
jgi:hypothetical protein